MKQTSLEIRLDIKKPESQAPRSWRVPIEEVAVELPLPRALLVLGISQAFDIEWTSHQGDPSSPGYDPWTRIIRGDTCDWEFTDIVT